MARKPTPRPYGEHLAKLTTMLRQVEADTTLPPAAKTLIKAALAELLTQFQALMIGKTH